MTNQTLESIRKLLIIIIIPLIMYLLNIFSGIFIPLTFGLFLALLFTPLMRWFLKNKIPKIIGVILILLLVLAAFVGTYKIVVLSSSELSGIDEEFISEFKERLNELSKPVVDLMGIEPEGDETTLSVLLNNDKIAGNLFVNIESGLNMARNFVVFFLLSMLFMVLFLLGSSNMKQSLNFLILKGKHESKNAYRQIEKDVFTFISVKVLMSVLTGLSISLACYFFGISFPIFWGTLAFIVNFIQLIGSVLLVIALSLFALVELNFTGSLFFFILVIFVIQALIGGILEPVLLGKSFSINMITILVMLTVWGTIWGAPGLILSVPVTVVLKTFLDKFEATRIYAKMMS